MRFLLVLFLILITTISFAEDIIIRQTDAYGVRYDKPYYVVKSDGKVIKYSDKGERIYSESGQIKNDEIIFKTPYGDTIVKYKISPYGNKIAETKRF